MEAWWLAMVVALSLAFDLTNGFHDSSNSLAAPVATRAMTPGQALAVTTVFTVLGPIVASTAVADTVGGLVEIDTGDVLQILTAALLAAVSWNLLTWWFGLPSSGSCSPARPEPPRRRSARPLAGGPRDPAGLGRHAPR